MARCHICERRLEHDHDPYQPKGHYASDHWEVVLRNGFIVESCWSCWFKWPDEHKTFPAVGFGRWPTSAYDLTLEQLLTYLREAA